MICKCGGQVEYTVAIDENTHIVLLQAYCPICGKTESAYGFSINEALEGVKKEWVRKKRIRRRQRQSDSPIKKVKLIQASS